MTNYKMMIEISAHSRVKYEYNKSDNEMQVDRLLTMSYPCHYGFIPNTLGGDGDPIDVLLQLSDGISLMPMSTIMVRPIGVLLTKDESGADAKILAVPSSKIDPFASEIRSYEDLPEILIKKIEHFFRHYKDLEKNKWVEIEGWQGVEAAHDIISQGFDNFSKEQNA